MITKATLLSWKICYTYHELDGVWARLRLPDEVSPMRVARARSVPIEDRIWVILRRQVLGDQLQPTLGQIVDRAVMRARLAMDAAGIEHRLDGLPAAGPGVYGPIGDELWRAFCAARAVSSNSDAAANASYTAAYAAFAVSYAYINATDEFKAAYCAALSAGRNGDEERAWQLRMIKRALP